MPDGKIDSLAADQENDNKERPTGDKPKRRRRRRRKRSGGEQDAAGSQQNPDTGPPSTGPEDDDQPQRRSRNSRSEPHRRRPHSDSTGQSEIFSDTPFEELGLGAPLLRALTDVGFTRATRIQADMIPLALAGKDILGQAKTGSGKTAAFGLPILERATPGEEFQAVILAPTRELAQQIASELRDFGRHTPFKIEAVYGGAPIPQQAERLARGPEIVVATPGRFIDMLERKRLHLRNVRCAVLDEVDRMLDIGFRDDIRRILKAIESRHQTVFVSATISEDIERLARTFMRESAERVESSAGSLTVDLVEQHYLTVERWDKKRLLLHLLTHEEPALTLVFCATKRMVDDLAEYLKKRDVDAHAIHGDLPQRKRNSIMNRFREGQLAVLVASDVAARGIDVDGISHVINYDIPEDSELYVHRIGRTARAGARGVAWSFVTPAEGETLTRIEKLANTHIPKMEYPDFTPGPVPRGVLEEREAQVARARKAAEADRFTPPPPPAAEQVDETRFPGGLVPKTYPPRRMRGVVKRRGR